MKKILLASVAVLFAIGIQSFSMLAPKPKPSGLYWFKISGQYSGSGPINQSHAAFLQQSLVAPTSDDCSGTQTYACIAGFEEDQVNTSTNQLINSLQTPEDVAYRKPN